MSGLDRRDFLALAAGTLAIPAVSGRNSAMAALSARAAASAVTAARSGSQAEAAASAGSWSDAIVVNALGSLEDPNPPPPQTTSSNRSSPGVTQAGSAPGARDGEFAERALRDAQASGLTAVNMTIGYTAGDMEPFEFTIRDIAQLDASIRGRPNELLKVLTARDILRAKREHRIGVIYGFQNAAMVGKDATRVDIFANLGVRVIQLTYNPANQLGDGSVAPQNRGLTPFGHEVIRRLNTNRVMVDLSHSGQRTCLDAARASRQPVSINHTGCRALVDLPRNKTDEELRLVASGGGFVGIYFMPFISKTGHATAQDVLAHIDHAVNVCGEDHVGIGTDGTVTPIDDLQGYAAVLAKEIQSRRTAGISAAGERPDTLPFVIDLRGVGQFRQLADRLQKRGYTMTRIEKLLGQNFLGYAKEVWGA